jgi:dihydroflavonol-4-reductase
VSAADVATGHVLVAERGASYRRYLLGSQNLHWREFHRFVSELCGTGGPYLIANRTMSLLSAAAMELAAGWTDTAPASTIAQARTVGRYYWYRHDDAAALGYAPRTARAALAEAIAWLVASHHVDESVRSWLRLTPAVTTRQEPAVP